MSENRPRLRIALVGLGDIARKAYLPLLSGHPGVEPLLCTRDPAALRQLARQYRISEQYTEVAALLAARPDAVMVHAATRAHYPLSIAVLQAGIPLFVDKPLANNYAHVEELLDLATRGDVPLFVGFNRRYAPLVAALREGPPPLQLEWHKNRADLAGEVSTYVYDDFIHVIDSLRWLVPGKPTELGIHYRLREGLLENVQLRWTIDDCVISAGMNRVSGRTEERIVHYRAGCTTVVEELHAGYRYEREGAAALEFGNWTPTLEKRGFVAMIEAWLRHVRRGTVDRALLDSYRKSHALCARIIDRIGGDQRR